MNSGLFPLLLHEYITYLRSYTILLHSQCLYLLKSSSYPGYLHSHHQLLEFLTLQHDLQQRYVCIHIWSWYMYQYILTTMLYIFYIRVEQAMSTVVLSGHGLINSFTADVAVYTSHDLTHYNYK